MALRAKKPEAVTKRLKLFMFGPAGVGKSTAAVQFPQSYIIDAERGTENYDKLITASGGAVFQTTDLTEVAAEVKSLLTEKHEYRTLVIDPITTLYNAEIDRCELRVGQEFGRHVTEAGKSMKRLFNLLVNLDMNVVMTAHAKVEYGDGMKKVGHTFDGWKSLDYLFDLVVELTKKNKKRYGVVRKSRIETFPDEDVFEWGYASIKKRYDDFRPGMLEKAADSVELATAEQVRAIRELLGIVKLPDGTVEKWFEKAQIDAGQWEDMPAEVVQKCIDFVRGRLPAPTTAS